MRALQISDSPSNEALKKELALELQLQPAGELRDVTCRAG